MIYTLVPQTADLTKPDPKRERLNRQGVLNRHPERVRAPLFQSGDFFDARDLVQSKYEMLRHFRVDGASKAEAAALFGMSRPTLYQAEAAFVRDGITGLLPKPRGPKRAHKLNDEVCAFLDEALAGDPQLRAGDLVDRVEEHFGVHVHPRSIERALARYREAKGSSKSR